VAILSVIYQVVMLGKIYLGEASVVAILLAIIRYLPPLRASVARPTGRRKVGHERRTDAQTVHVGYFHATRL
jgi:hypothetical protein